MTDTEIYRLSPTEAAALVGMSVEEFYQRSEFVYLLRGSWVQVAEAADEEWKLEVAEYQDEDDVLDRAWPQGSLCMRCRDVLINRLKEVGKVRA